MRSKMERTDLMLESWPQTVSTVKQLKTLLSCSMLDSMFVWSLVSNVQAFLKNVKRIVGKHFL